MSAAEEAELYLQNNGDDQEEDEDDLVIQKTNDGRPPAQADKKGKSKDQKGLTLSGNVTRESRDQETAQLGQKGAKKRRTRSPSIELVGQQPLKKRKMQQAPPVQNGDRSPSIELMVQPLPSRPSHLKKPPTQGRGPLLSSQTSIASSTSSSGTPRKLIPIVEIPTSRSSSQTRTAPRRPSALSQESSNSTSFRNGILPDASGESKVKLSSKPTASTEQKRQRSPSIELEQIHSTKKKDTFVSSSRGDRSIVQQKFNKAESSKKKTGTAITTETGKGKVREISPELPEPTQSKLTNANKNHGRGSERMVPLPLPSFKRLNGNHSTQPKEKLNGHHSGPGPSFLPTSTSSSNPAAVVINGPATEQAAKPKPPLPQPHSFASRISELKVMAVNKPSHPLAILARAAILDPEVGVDCYIGERGGSHSSDGMQRKTTVRGASIEKIARALADRFP